MPAGLPPERALCHFLVRQLLTKSLFGAFFAGGTAATPLLDQSQVSRTFHHVLSDHVFGGSVVMIGKPEFSDDGRTQQFDGLSPSEVRLALWRKFPNRLMEKSGVA